MPWTDLPHRGRGRFFREGLVELPEKEKGPLRPFVRLVAVGTSSDLVQFVVLFSRKRKRGRYAPLSVSRTRKLCRGWEYRDRSVNAPSRERENFGKAVKV
jgi:hypothetical protein